MISSSSLLASLRRGTSALLAGMALLAALPAHAVSTTVVISQVYGGGGNSGATLKNDFIELHNISSASVDVSTWSVQYGAATSSAWAVTPLTGSIPAGGYYLVQEAQGAGGTASLPTPDASGSLAMSATAGKVALSNSTTPLTGASPSAIDLVGFGPTANGYEGSPTPVLSNTTAALRKDAGSTDTDNNANDFTVGAPSPRNSATAPYTPAATATQVRVETAAGGSGVVVPSQTLGSSSSLTVYAVSRDGSAGFIANPAATWSLTNVTGGVVSGDLVASGDGKSATLTSHAAGTATIHAVVSGLTSVDSGTITVTTASTNPAASVVASSTDVVNSGTVVLTATITPGANPASTGLTVTGDLSALGGSSTQAFTAGANNTFTYTAAIPATLAGGAKSISIVATDAQSRTASAALSLNLRGNLVIFHNNDTHARVTPHYWVVPAHTADPASQFEPVGGAAYTGGKVLQLAGAQPDALVLDGGDISEGNPVGDWNGPGNPVGSFGNGIAVQFYQMLDTKLRAISGRGGRGLDAMVVGNHDIRDISYINNLKNQTNFPVISINICNKGTQTPYFAPYAIVNVNGNKVGIIGYTTENADSPESAVNNLIDVVACDWAGTGSKIHFSSYVNQLRSLGCNLIILLTHDGHSDLSTSSSGSTPILVDTSAAKLPEIAVTGHWHTYSDTVWQPTSLNYKTIFTEDGSFEHYVGELRVNGAGQYLSNANYPLRNADITPDPDIASFVQAQKDAYNATNPPYQTDQVLGYTADDLLLDNKMKWWTGDEYPWAGNNTAGNWICDALQWKAEQYFGACDLSIESGGGVRSDIPAGPVTFTEIYETYPWADDTLYVVKMTGQDIWNYIKGHGCDVALSGAWHVTAFDGVPTSITYNGGPIDLAHVYNVSISNYMYLHDSVPFTDPNPTTSTVLNRTALMEYMARFPQGNPYHAGVPRYTLNTEFAGGYRAVVTVMNDADSSTAFDDAFIRFLSATPETMGHLGTQQVPTTLVNADGSFNASHRLSEIELYRSYLGFRTGVLKPGDIIETWGKGSFYQGNPEFVDQEGITANGVEFRIVGHDASLAKPSFMPSIGSFMDDDHKNHYVQFIGRKTGTSTVVDQNGRSLTISDVTAYANKTLPGSSGDLLVLTGIPTSENYALRFRCDSAAAASTIGVTAFPATSTVSSHANGLTAFTTANSVALTATAQVNSAGTYSLTPVADSQVSSGNPNSNYGTTNNLYIQSASSGFGNERAWLRFDLLSIPAGFTINSASLQLYCWSTAGASLPVEVRTGATDSWVESGTGGITWNNQPGLNSVLATQTLTSGTKNLYYSWDVTSAAQTELAGDKTLTLVAKPVTESSTDSTAPSYAFDSHEYGTTGPVLKITTQSTGPTITVASVQYYYRYSADNTSWGAWTAGATVTTAPYAANFTFAHGEGYYEFYTVATDSLGATEPVPASAQAAVHYSSTIPYTTSSFLALANLIQGYDGNAHAATVTSVPAVAVAVTYNGSATPPTAVGSYSVSASVTSSGYVGAISGVLTITAGSQAITFGPLAPHSYGSGSFALTATASSGLPVTYTSSNPAVATVSGSTVTLVGIGSTTITASQAGDANYAAATSVPQTLTVTQTTQTIAFAPLAAHSVGDAPFALSATASSGLTVAYASSNPLVATVSGSTVTIVGAGTTTITASQAGNTTYAAATPVSQDLVVNGASGSGDVPLLPGWGLALLAGLLCVFAFTGLRRMLPGTQG